MHSRMLAVLDEGDSVEFGGGGEGQDFAIRPIKRKIHKGVRGEIGRGRLRAGRQDDSPSTFEPAVITHLFKVGKGIKIGIEQ